MVTRTYRYAILLVALAVALAIAQAARDVAAQDPTGVTHVVRINSTTGADPDTLKSRVGDTVVWSNGVPQVPMAVIFDDGNPVKRACAAPTLFYLAPDGTYTSGLIPPGGVASLCFIRAGMYKYRVIGSHEEKSVIGSGTVLVQ